MWIVSVAIPFGTDDELSNSELGVIVECTAWIFETARFGLIEYMTGIEYLVALPDKVGVVSLHLNQVDSSINICEVFECLARLASGTAC